jgi:hypothetical protein
MGIPPFQINKREWEALFDEPHHLFKVYAAIRRHMDYETGLAGIRRHFSEQFFRELLYVDPRPGRPKSVSGSPSKKEIYYSLEAMTKIVSRDDLKTPLLIIRKDLGTFVFELPLATTDKSVQKQRGTNGELMGDTMGDIQNADETSNDAGLADVQQDNGGHKDFEYPPQWGTPPYSVFVNNTTTTTTANLKQSRAEQPTADCGGGGEDEKKKPDAQTEQRHMPLVCAVPEALIYPRKLRQPEQAVAGRMVAGLGEQAQQLLDVLAAAIAAGEIRKTPLDYLQGLIRRCQDGTFDPTPGLPIAEQRKPVQTQSQGPSAREKAAERAMDDRLREYERQMQRPRAP